MMKKHLAVTFVCGLVAATGSAWAGGGEADYAEHTAVAVSQLSRDQVRSEAIAAMRAGTLSRGEGVEQDQGIVILAQAHIASQPVVATAPPAAAPQPTAAATEAPAAQSSAAAAPEQPAAAAANQPMAANPEPPASPSLGSPSADSMAVMPRKPEDEAAPADAAAPKQ
jgi:Domain of unknown function (DUF4148)